MKTCNILITYDESSLREPDIGGGGGPGGKGLLNIGGAGGGGGPREFGLVSILSVKKNR